MKIFINILTLSRILISIIIFILLMSPDSYGLALILFFIAGFSDFFDGYLARKYNSVSELGEILDPISDKILIVFLFIALSVNLNSYLIGFAASIIITRELWVAALRNINAIKNRTTATKVTFLAKIKTTLQLSCIGIYLLALTFNKMLLVVIGDIFLIIAVLITIYTGYLYTLASFKNESRN